MSFPCHWCPCVFCSESDLAAHLSVFGDKEHFSSWIEALRVARSHVEAKRPVFGSCLYPDARRPKVVFLAVDSLLYCVGCVYFRMSGVIS